MSLYGPKLRLPKMEVPGISRGPSWNLEKEKQLFIYGAIAVLIIAIALLAGPTIITMITREIDSMLNPTIRVNWSNNPMDVTKGVKESEMELLITNTTKEEQKLVAFNVTTLSDEVIIFCPPSLYDAEQKSYVLENLAQGDQRKVPCIVRRNPDSTVFTGSYTIEITTSLGNTKTNLEIITK
jgi:hypothetical protein